MTEIDDGLVQTQTLTCANLLLDTLKMFEWLLDTDSFFTRFCCSPNDAWQGGLATVSQIADAVIFFAYVSIPYSMWRLARLHVVIDIRQLSSRLIWLLYKAFILSCGLTHAMDILAFYWPAYRLFVFVKLICALFSITTALSLAFAEHLIERRRDDGGI